MYPPLIDANSATKYGNRKTITLMVRSHGLMKDSIVAGLMRVRKCSCAECEIAAPRKNLIDKQACLVILQKVAFTFDAFF